MTGILGYFGKRASLCERRQSRKAAPRLLVIVSAWQHVAHRPARLRGSFGAPASGPVATVRDAIIGEMNNNESILFSGGAPGAEAEFGACAERHGVEEVNFTFDGHTIERRRGVRVLNHEELQNGDVSLAYVGRLMHRRYTDSPTIRKVLQTLWYQVNHGQEIYVVGTILDDGTVRGGTGWGAEFAKLCNKPLHVFDQEKGSWFEWTGDTWQQAGGTGPTIAHAHFTGTGTRHLRDSGKRAIEALFTRSFR